jgi:hypothetical protein
MVFRLLFFFFSSTTGIKKEVRLTFSKLAVKGGMLGCGYLPEV